MWWAPCPTTVDRRCTSSTPRCCPTRTMAGLSSGRATRCARVRLSKPWRTPFDGMSRADLVGLLRHLPGEIRKLVEEGFVSCHFEFGEVIVREGAAADALYVLSEGQARVVAAGAGGQEVLLDTLGPGDSFGEMGLLDARAVRTASVRARSEVEAMRLDAAVFRALVATNPEVRAAAENLARDRALRTFLRVLTAFGEVGPGALDALIDALEPRSVAAGTKVFDGVRTRPLGFVEEGRLEVRRGAEVVA